MRAAVLVALLASSANADDRITRLASFMEAYGCKHDLASTYVDVADRHGLDYRLLPAISIVESSCGRFMRANNLFGWNSGRARFRTVREAVEKVSKQVSSWSLDTQGVLKRYNPSRRYPKKVLAWMEKIDVTRSISNESSASRTLEGARRSDQSSSPDSVRDLQDQGSFSLLLARPNRTQACTISLERELQFGNWTHSELP